MGDWEEIDLIIDKGIREKHSLSEIFENIDTQVISHSERGWDYVPVSIFAILALRVRVVEAMIDIESRNAAKSSDIE